MPTSSPPPTTETRRAYRRRTAILALANGWLAGMGGWTAVLAIGLLRGDTYEWMQVPVWLVLFGALQLVFMAPGAVAFWIWHRRAPLSAQRPAVALPLGMGVGLTAMVLWAAVFGTLGKSPTTDFVQGPVLCVAAVAGAATFLVGARSRRGEHDLVPASEETRAGVVSAPGAPE
ncbi:MAG: hypothetical protein AAGB93_11920 [Planctomycetota bacterium]